MRMKHLTYGVFALFAAFALLLGLLPGTAHAASELPTLTFSDTGISETVSGSGYKISGTTLTIQDPGTYHVTGACAEGNIVIKKGTTGVVLALEDLDLACSTTAPLACNKTTEVDLRISGSVRLTDAEDPAQEDVSEDFEGAAIKVKSGASLRLLGDGDLTVDASQCKNGIKGGAEAELTIALTGSGALSVTAANNGIACDGTLTILGGEISVTAGNEGLKAEPDADDTASAGAITIENGEITIDTLSLSGGDGIQAFSNVTINGGSVAITAYADGIASNGDLTITGGSFDIRTLGGYQSSGFDADTMSAKGLKAAASDDTTENATNTITVTGGDFTLDCADDAVHSDGYIVIKGGSFDIRTGDDGMHADTSLTLGSEMGLARDPYVLIRASYEGLEAGNIFILGGKYAVNASDDGINAAGGSSSGSGGSDSHFNPGGRPGGRGQQGFGGGQMAAGGDYSLNIYGGDIYVTCLGDGLDSNGSITLGGGNIEVWSASSGDNEPLDCDGALTIDGATVLAAGCAGMGGTRPAGQSYRTFSGSIASGKVLTILSNSGEVLYSALAPKSASYCLFSCPASTGSETAGTASGSVDCEGGDCSAVHHSFGGGVVTAAATESATGVITYTCSSCGTTERQTTPRSAAVFEDDWTAPEEDGGEEDTFDEAAATSYVERAYETILRREGDAEGIANWVAALSAGASAGEIIDVFFRSEEYRAFGRTSAETVTLCYEAMLSRAPEEEGLAAWTALLDDGYSTTKLVAGFVGSEEFIALCENYGIPAGSITLSARDQNSNITRFVERCYECALSRASDEKGLINWCEQLLDGSLSAERTAFGFLFSGEAIAQELTDEVFLTVLYELMLDREPDADGLSNWLAALEAETANVGAAQARQNIYARFAASGEFALMCANFGL